MTGYRGLPLHFGGAVRGRSVATFEGPRTCRDGGWYWPGGDGPMRSVRPGTTESAVGGSQFPCHGRRRPATHDFAACNKQRRGWPAFAGHDTEIAARSLGGLVPGRTRRRGDPKWTSALKTLHYPLPALFDRSLYPHKTHKPYSPRFDRYPIRNGVAPVILHRRFGARCPSPPCTTRLNSRSGSGSRLLDNASIASCRSSTLGFSEISTMALRTASAVATTLGEAKSLIRLISPIRRCSSPPSAISSRV